MNVNRATTSATTSGNQTRLLTGRPPPTARITTINTIIHKSDTSHDPDLIAAADAARPQRRLSSRTRACVRPGELTEHVSRRNRSYASACSRDVHPRHTRAITGRPLFAGSAGSQRNGGRRPLEDTPIASSTSSVTKSRSRSSGEIIPSGRSSPLHGTPGVLVAFPPNRDRLHRRPPQPPRRRLALTAVARSCESLNVESCGPFGFAGFGVCCCRALMSTIRSCVIG